MEDLPSFLLHVRASRVTPITRISCSLIHTLSLCPHAGCWALLLIRGLGPWSPGSFSASNDGLHYLLLLFLSMLLLSDMALDIIKTNGRSNCSKDAPLILLCSTHRDGSNWLCARRHRPEPSVVAGKVAAESRMEVAAGRADSRFPS